MVEQFKSVAEAASELAARLHAITGKAPVVVRRARVATIKAAVESGNLYVELSPLHIEAVLYWEDERPRMRQIACHPARMENVASQWAERLAAAERD